MTRYVKRGTPTWLEDVNGNVALELRGGKAAALVTASTSAQGVEFSGIPGLPVKFMYAGFSPCVVASLIAGSTVSRAAGVVTVAAAAHGVPATTNNLGIFFPGSPGLASGFYGTLTVIDVNTISFTAAGPDFAPQSVNGGAAFLSTAQLGTFVLPANWLNGKTLTGFVRMSGDGLSGNHTVQLTLGGTVVSSFSLTTSPFGAFSQSVSGITDSAQVGATIYDGAAVTPDKQVNASVNTAVDTVVGIQVALAAAQRYVVVYAAHATLF